VEFDFANGERRVDGCFRGGIDNNLSMFGHEEMALVDCNNFGGSESINLFDERLQGVRVRVLTGEPCAGQPLTPLAKELTNKGKRKKAIRTDADREYDRKRNKSRGSNANIVAALAAHSEGIDSPKRVADMFAKQAAREQIHEATVIDLAAVRKRADDNAEELQIEKNKRAQTAAKTVTREMKVERDGFLERISELEEGNTLHKDTLKAVQSSHAEAMKQLKRDAKGKVAAAELAGKRSDLKAQRAVKAKKKANEEKEEANAVKKNMAISLVRETWVTSDLKQQLGEQGKELSVQQDAAAYQTEEAQRFRGKVSTELPCRKILTMCMYVFCSTASLA
jgi:hypothetical protein